MGRRRQSSASATSTSPCRDRQRADDFFAAQHHHFVHHVDDANVIGNDPDDVADIGAGVAAGEVERAVLLGKARDFALE